MGKVAKMIVTAVVGAVIAGSTFGVGAFALGFSFKAFAASIALGALSSAMAPKQKSTGSLYAGGSGAAGSFSARAEGMTQNVRQSVTTRRILYGEARVGGALTFIETTSSDRFLHIVVTMVDHEVDAIGEIWFDDTSIPIDAIDSNGFVTSGPYSGRVRIKKHLGAADQLADPDLVSETSVADSFRGRGIAYIYARLEYNRDVFPSQIPVITAWVRGRKMLDVRDDVTRWSPNVALMVNDYLTAPLTSLTPGVGASQAIIDEDEITASANICEEMVTVADMVDEITAANDTLNTLTLVGVNSRLQYQTGDRIQLTGSSLPGGLSAATNYYVIPYQRRGTLRIQLATSLSNAIAGTAIDITSSGTGTITKNAEPRYFGGGVIETSAEPQNNVDDLLTGMAGSAVYIGGRWHILAGAYRTPEFTFDENHIIGSLIIRPKVSRKDRFNLIKGLYVTPINDGQPADYPSVSNAAYVAADGRVLPTDFDLPVTQRASTAQRLSKIKLEKHRQEIFFDAPFSLHASRVQPGDVVYINNSRMGWSSKPFEVIKWSLEQKEINGAPLFYIQMSLQETASTVYDWNNGEETHVDPAPDTNLPDPFNVGLPGAPTIFEELVFTRAGSGVKVKVTVSAAAATDPFIARYQFRYRPVSGGEYITLPEKTIPEDVIFDVDPGTYRFECRAINQLNQKSAWVVNSPLEVYGLLTPPGPVTGLTIQAISSFALMRWDEAADIDVLEGGTVRFRHSPEFTGAEWSTSTSIGDAVPGRAVDTILPLKPGTYLARFFDSSKIPGPTVAITTKAATVLNFGDIDSLVEHPTFAGDKTSMTVDAGELTLSGSGLWDDIADLDAVADIDYFGGISTSGVYTFVSGFDFTTVKKVRLESHVKARIINTLDNFDDRTGNVDDWEDWDGANAGSADFTVWVRETDDDPSDEGATWSEWQRLDVGEYEARGIQCQGRAITYDPAYNIKVEELAVYAVEQLT